MGKKTLCLFLLLVLVVPALAFSVDPDNTLAENNFSIELNKIGASRIAFCEVEAGNVVESTEINEVVFDSYRPVSGQGFSTDMQFGIIMDVYPPSASSSTTLDVNLVFSCDSNYYAENGMLRGAKVSSDNKVIFLNYDVVVTDGSDNVGTVVVSDDISNKLTAGLAAGERTIQLLSNESVPVSGLKKTYRCTLEINEGNDEDSIIMDNIYSGLAILLVEIK